MTLAYEVRPDLSIVSRIRYVPKSASGFTKTTQEPKEDDEQIVRLLGEMWAYYSDMLDENGNPLKAPTRRTKPRLRDLLKPGSPSMTI